MTLMSAELSEHQFQKISHLIYRASGIHLKKGKEALVRARLMKRLRVLKMASIADYMHYIASDQGVHELAFLIDVMTTNKTSFFREREHFDYLCEAILPELTASRLRFWSAACSSGEEPFSLAMLLREHVVDVDRKDVLILATDISRTMLEKARHGIYRRESLRQLPPLFLQKYFVKLHQENSNFLQVHQHIRKMVRFARLNLLDPWPMKGPFDGIFCRNVMIYFDKSTQQALINRFWELLTPGGHLFVGHSEGLSAISHNFRYIRPATYRK